MENRRRLGKCEAVTKWRRNYSDPPLKPCAGSKIPTTYLPFSIRPQLMQQPVSSDGPTGRRSQIAAKDQFITETVINRGGFLNAWT